MFTKLFVNAKISAHFFMKNRDGVTAIEYAIIAAAMAVMLLAIFSPTGTLTTAITAAFKTISDALNPPA